MEDTAVPSQAPQEEHDDNYDNQYHPTVTENSDSQHQQQEQEPDKNKQDEQPINDNSAPSQNDQEEADDNDKQLPQQNQEEGNKQDEQDNNVPVTKLRMAHWPDCGPHPDERFVFCIIPYAPYSCKWALLERDNCQEQWALTTVWRTDIIPPPSSRQKATTSTSDKENEELEDASTTTTSSNIATTPCQQLSRYVPPFLIQRLFSKSDYTATSAMTRRLRELIPTLRVFLVTDDDGDSTATSSTTQAAQHLAWAFSEAPSLLYRVPQSQIVDTTNSQAHTVELEYTVVRGAAIGLAGDRSLMLLESSNLLTLEYLPNRSQHHSIFYQTSSIMSKFQALQQHTGKLPGVRLQELLSLYNSSKDRRSPLNYTNTRSNMAASVFGETCLYLEHCLLNILEHHWLRNNNNVPLFILAGLEARLLWNVLFEYSRFRTIRVEWQPSEEKDSMLLVLRVPNVEQPYYMKCVVHPHLVFDRLKVLLNTNPPVQSAAQTLRNAVMGCRVAKFLDLKVFRGFVSLIEKVNDELDNESIEHDVFVISYDDNEDVEEFNLLELYNGLLLYVNEFESGDAPEMADKRIQAKQAANLLLQSCKAIQEHVKKTEQQPKKKMRKNHEYL